MSSSYKWTRRQTIEALSGFAAVGSLLAGGDDGPTIAAAAGATDAKWLTLPPTPTLPDTTRKGIATVNGTDVFYAQFGQGPPVLLLHGGLANSNYWGLSSRAPGSSFLSNRHGHARPWQKPGDVACLRLPIVCRRRCGPSRLSENSSGLDRRLERRRRHRASASDDQA